MAVEAADFAHMLTEAGVSLVAGVPCSILTGLQTALEASPNLAYLPAANEGSALGIACGAFLSGRRGAVMMQNSGVGNAINPLTSLALTFRLGALLIISRHDPVLDEPQHRAMVALTPVLLQTLGIRTLDLERNAWSLRRYAGIVAGEIEGGRVVAITIPR